MPLFERVPVPLFCLGGSPCPSTPTRLKTTRYMIRALPFLLITSLLIGCGGYKFSEAIAPLETGQPEAAYTYLQKHAPKNSDIPFLFELGLVAHYADHFLRAAQRWIKPEILPRIAIPRVFQKK